MSSRNYQGVWVVVLAVVSLGARCYQGDGEKHNARINWIGAELARSIDRQFGPAVTNQNPLPGDGTGSHEGDRLRGRTNPRVVREAVRLLAEQALVPADPTQAQGLIAPPAALTSQLRSIAAASVDNNPCRHDTDQDGTPDFEEDLDTDPRGLCTDPAAVQCLHHGDKSFTVKFSHCRPTAAASTVLWSPEALSTVCPTYGAANFSTTPISSSMVFLSCANGGTVAWPAGSSVFGFRFTNTTTNSTLTAPALGWYTGSVGCFGSTTLLQQTVFRPWPFLLTCTTDQFRQVQLYYDGAITLHYGQGGVDEQLYNVRYNRFTRIWGDANSASPENDRFLTLDGQALEYRVTDPFGNPAAGTTPFPAGVGLWEPRPDGMWVENFHVRFDADGRANPLPQADYRVQRGVDFEDGRFLLDWADGVVSLKDQNGDDPADLLSSPGVGITLDGVRLLGRADGRLLLAFNFYDADNPLGDGLPQNNLGGRCGEPLDRERCRVEVAVDLEQRLYDVTDVDRDHCPMLWDWTPTNPDYQNLDF